MVVAGAVWWASNVESKRGRRVWECVMDDVGEDVVGVYFYPLWLLCGNTIASPLGRILPTRLGLGGLLVPGGLAAFRCSSSGFSPLRRCGLVRCSLALRGGGGPGRS